jgi:hypothetical protein
LPVLTHGEARVVTQEAKIESRHCTDCEQRFEVEAGVFDRDCWSFTPDEKRPRCAHCLARRERFRSEIARLTDDELVSRTVKHAAQCGVQGSGLVIYCFATTDRLELDFACKELRRRLGLRPKETT